MDERLLYAHSRNVAGQRHELIEHLQAVSGKAAAFARPFGGSALAELAGLVHDLGKMHPDWQRYLLEAEAHPHLRGTGPEHKGAGAVFLMELGIPDLALLVQGHHGGLPSRGTFLPWLRSRQQDPAVRESIAIA